MDYNLIKQRVLSLQPISVQEALYLYREVAVEELLAMGNTVRFAHIPEKRVSWQIDRNVNYTNICYSGCLFCNFHCSLRERDRGYTTTYPEYRDKIRGLIDLGGDQLLLQGGLHPEYGIEFYEELFSWLKHEYPTIKLNALGPPEIAHISKKSKLSIRDVLVRLKEAGLDSLPGAGAEILSDRVRKLISPAKPNTEAWIGVMREAHRLNIDTTATMVFGHIETIEERIEHLITLRSLQSEAKELGSKGFTAFICWTMQSNGTALSQKFKLEPPSAIEYLKMIAISRIALNNIPHIQASWLTTGRSLGQMALHCGADDMGSIMIEENVVSSVGVKNRMDSNGIQEAIKEAGFTPWLRNQRYEER